MIRTNCAKKVQPLRSKSMHEVATHTSPDVLAWLKVFMPSLPEVVDFPTCNNADLDWCVRMPTNPPPVYPKFEMLPWLCEEKGPTLDPTLTVIVSFHIEMGM